MALNELNLIPTKAALAKKSQSLDQFKCTTFESHKPKQKSLTDKKLDNIDKTLKNIFDMKRAKHEVFSFGTSGLESKDKEVAKIAFAVKLGAKPPKNKYKNYKELLAEKKVLQEKERESDALSKVGKNAQGGASVTYKQIKNANRKRKLNAPINQHYGVVNPKIVKRKKK
ncbi:hypothetical protein HA402_011445 [Bradysia odoriphaga]|nr:hypothetical protein HA402_011445 [Bradysia odoriphaga]